MYLIICPEKNGKLGTKELKSTLITIGARTQDALVATTKKNRNWPLANKWVISYLFNSFRTSFNQFRDSMGLMEFTSNALSLASTAADIGSKSAPEENNLS